MAAHEQCENDQPQSEADHPLHLQQPKKRSPHPGNERTRLLILQPLCCPPGLLLISGFWPPAVKLELPSCGSSLLSLLFHPRTIRPRRWRSWIERCPQGSRLVGRRRPFLTRKRLLTQQSQRPCHHNRKHPASVVLRSLQPTSRSNCVIVRDNQRSKVAIFRAAIVPRRLRTRRCLRRHHIAAHCCCPRSA